MKPRWELDQYNQNIQTLQTHQINPVFQQKIKKKNN